MSLAFPISREGSRARARPRARRARTPWWLELAVVVWLGWIYDATTNLAPLRLHAALANAQGLFHFEHSLHLDPELSLDRWLAGHHTLATVLSDYYDNAHWALTLGLLMWLWWRRAELYRPLRNSLVLVNLLGFVVFWRYPVAPPRMLPGFTDVVSSTHAFLDSHGGGVLAAHANQVAAMPSLHMAWAAWCGLALWQLSARRWVRVLAVLYPSLTAFTVVATGNHFALDLLAGLATLALALLALRAPAAIGAAWRASAAARSRSLGRLDRRRRVLRERASAPAYRMSQSCYEVQDQVE